MDIITLPLSSKVKIVVIGLGYVGLPLAMAFAKKFRALGYDISSQRVDDLKQGIDATNEFSASELKLSDIEFSSNSKEISNADFYIISVPTPVDKDLEPDMSMLISASELVGQNLREGNFVIYESTVYPGATEEVCLPVLEKYSGLKLNEDFFLGYSPERINPSDKLHQLDSIIKVVSGSNEYASKIVDALYSSIISKSSKTPNLCLANIK